VCHGARAPSETGPEMVIREAIHSLTEAPRRTNHLSSIARLLSTLQQTSQILANWSRDNYNTVFRSNAPFSFTATPFSVTIAEMSSAGVTSKLGL